MTVEPGTSVMTRPAVPLMTRFQVASVFRVNPVTISKWETETPPLPVHTRGKRGRSSKYDLSEVVAWYIERERASLGGRNGRLSREAEQAKLAAAQTERIGLFIAHRKGELLEKRLVEEAITTMLTAFRSRLLSLPRALAERLVGELGKGPQAVEAVISEAVRGCLTALSEWRHPR